MFPKNCQVRRKLFTWYRGTGVCTRCTCVYSTDEKNKRLFGKQKLHTFMKNLYIQEVHEKDNMIVTYKIIIYLF